MKKYKINYFTSTDDIIKCAIVERFNRTLRNRIYRFLSHNSTKRYINVLQDIVESYNNSFHRTIGMSPSHH
uniref:Integrase catalytic domain-containing protein n=1 Tax=Tetranychus urticae TaxID=32264 RepID=A0A158P516_TETUR